MKKIIFSSILILLTYNSYAQDREFDSIRATIVKLPDDSVKVNSLIEMGTTISNSDPKAALNVFTEAINIAEKINFVRGLARAHHQAGNAHYFSSDHVMALEEWMAAEFHYAELEDLAGVANMLSNSGSIYYDQDELNKALELYLKALSIAEKIGDKKRIATVQLNIGTMHFRRKEFDLALDTYLNALFVFKELNNSEGIGLASSNAGVVYTQKDMNKKALEMYLIALEHVRSTPYLADGLRNIGDINIKIGNFDKGLLYLDSAYMEATKTGNVREVASALNALGGAYKKRAI